MAAASVGASALWVQEVQPRGSPAPAERPAACSPALPTSFGSDAALGPRSDGAPGGGAATDGSAPLGASAAPCAPSGAALRFDELLMAEEMLAADPHAGDGKHAGGALAAALAGAWRAAARRGATAWRAKSREVAALGWSVWGNERRARAARAHASRRAAAAAAAPHAAGAPARYTRRGARQR